MDAPRTAGRPSLIAMEALDGNAIAGSLFEYFGFEMTSVRGRCTHCGAIAPVAELAVYTRAPGAVARCRTCGEVAMVLVNARGSMELHAGTFELPEPA